MKRNYWNQMMPVAGANMGPSNVAGANMGPSNVAGANMGPSNVAGAMDFMPDCPPQTIYDQPETVLEDVYHPQQVNVVHPINIVKQHHCCPVYNHCYTYSEKDVMVSSVKRGKRTRTSSKRSKKR
ncbi:hypothetical protein [Paenibacillus montanisoli]|uniref:Spore coat protein n=1 Tax=Paenibacillus montanisoli TaxID=2081970 RepID=A0A328TUE6_9BACL|nr:hypothetical protein [Paenibacillus montanisoli]RAP74168.1 hypothetical protein DL346_24185 [Paenibacillus montanisoli]